jgi:HK97 family phage prohead protease
MPYKIEKDAGACSVSKPWAVKNSQTGKVYGCHPSKADAQKQLAALNANVPDASASADKRKRMGEETANGNPPRVNLVRAVSGAIEARAADKDGGMPTLFGHFAVFNVWTEINSFWEGHFLERIMPGAFKKTIRENRSRIRALFQHGQDPQVGDKPLGPVEVLREEDEGPYYEVPMLDTAYNRELVPGLEAGLYGASFRFEVLREEFAEEPGESEDNPHGIPERSVKEIKLHEFGPVTWPAYAEATAGVRSLTDHFLFEQIAREPERARELIALTHEFARVGEAPEAADAAPKKERTSEAERREPRFRDREEFLSWIDKS